MPKPAMYTIELERFGKNYRRILDNVVDLHRRAGKKENRYVDIWSEL